MITKRKLNKILQEEIAKAKALHFKLHSIQDIEELPKAVSFYAQCCYVNNTTRKIRVSYFYLDAPEDEIRETIMHEVLHCVVGSVGHGELWKECVRKVNATYDYGINPTPYNFKGDRWDLRAARERWRQSR